MENHNKYCKVLQTTYPRPTNEWHPTEDKNPNTLVHKLNKGHQRWKDLPKPVEVTICCFKSAIFVVYGMLCYAQIFIPTILFSLIGRMRDCPEYL